MTVSNVTAGYTQNSSEEGGSCAEDCKQQMLHPVEEAKGRRRHNERHNAHVSAMLAPSLGGSDWLFVKLAILEVLPPLPRALVGTSRLCHTLWWAISDTFSQQNPAPLTTIMTTILLLTIMA
jgi:hypothetical protein